MRERHDHRLPTHLGGLPEAVIPAWVDQLPRVCQRCRQLQVSRAHAHPTHPLCMDRGCLTMTSALPRTRLRLAPLLPAHSSGRPRRPSSLEFAHRFRGKSQNGFASTPPRLDGRGILKQGYSQQRRAAKGLPAVVVLVTNLVTKPGPIQGFWYAAYWLALAQSNTELAPAKSRNC